MELEKWTERHSVDETVGAEDGERELRRERKLLEEDNMFKENYIKEYFCFLNCGMACMTLLQRSRVKIYIILQGFWRQIIVSLNVAMRQLGLYRIHREKYIAYGYFFPLNSVYLNYIS